jgi:NTP pyrophosphatase (non-canonical NTP hydrolase)
MNEHTLLLPLQPTMQDFQAYAKKLECIRGFDNDQLIEKCLLLGEEVGELFKAIRSLRGIKIDHASAIGTVQEELADIFIYLLTIANRCNIDLEKAFREKEEKNKQRTWSKSIQVKTN